MLANAWQTTGPRPTDLVRGRTWLIPGGPNGFSPTAATEILPYHSSASAAGDLNLDGHGDFLAVYGTSIVVMPGGAGGPAEATHLDVAGYSSVTTLWITDMNGDGLPDVVALAARRATPAMPDLLWFPGRSGALPATNHQGERPFGERLDREHLRIADLDGDGAAEVVVFKGHRVRIFDGRRIFSGANPAYDVEHPTVDFAEVLGDTDGDGRSELGLGEPAFELVYRAQGRVTAYQLDNGALTPRWQLDGDEQHRNLGAYMLPVGDANRDGFDDVGLAGSAMAPLTIWLGGPTGLRPSYTIASVPSESQDNAVFADGNGDGRTDVVRLIGPRLAGVVHFQSGVCPLEPTFNETIRGTEIWAMLGQHLSAGDVDGDGIDDLFSPNFWVAGHDASPRPFSGYWVTDVRDLDADGYDDVLSGGRFIHLGGPQGPAQRAIETPTNSLLAGEVNGDGIPDLIDIGQEIRLFHGVAGGLPDFQAPVSRLAGPNGTRERCVADIDGDGRTELIASTTDGTWIWPPTARGTLGAPRRLVDGRSTVLAACGDYDGDGTDDLLMMQDGRAMRAGRAPRALGWMRGTRRGLLPIQPWSVRDDIPDPLMETLADIDEDGDDELAIHRLEQGEPVIEIYLGGSHGPAPAPTWVIPGAASVTRVRQTPGAAASLAWGLPEAWQNLEREGEIRIAHPGVCGAGDEIWE